MKDFYRTGEFARMCGCSADTLRHYERLGLIEKPIRSANGYREYGKETFNRVRLIQAALGVGFSLKELSRILSIRDAGGIPCKEVRDIAEAKLHDLQSRIHQMTLARNQLQQIIREWNESLQRKAPGRRAGLLEKLSQKQVITRRQAGLANLKRRM